MLGLLIFGDMSDRLGRRAIFIANLFFVVFAILSAFVTTTTQLFIVRFLVGVGVGMNIPASTAYLAEIAPRRERGRVFGSMLNPSLLGMLAGTMLIDRIGRKTLCYFSRIQPSDARDGIAS